MSPRSSHSEHKCRTPSTHRPDGVRFRTDHPVRGRPIVQSVLISRKAGGTVGFRVTLPGWEWRVFGTALAVLGRQKNCHKSVTARARVNVPFLAQTGPNLASVSASWRQLADEGLLCNQEVVGSPRYARNVSFRSTAIPIGSTTPLDSLSRRGAPGPLAGAFVGSDLFAVMDPR